MDDFGCILKNGPFGNLLGIFSVICYMIRSIAILLLTWVSGPIPWHYDLQEAESVARREHHHILLSFSGSDWCGPCIRLHKEILEQDVFLRMADTSLVMVNADFPRMKKNQLPAKQQQLNDAMADKYNSQGKFPFTVLLTADGKVLKTWDGFPGVSPEEFARQVQNSIDADK